MAIFSTSRNKLLTNNDGLYEVIMLTNKDGSLVDSDRPLRVSLGSDSITITGSVNVGTTVEISNEEGNPIPTHAHLFDENDDEYSNTNPFTIDGTVDIGNEVAINDGGNSITVDGNVSVSNFPATQTVDGTVNIGTLPEIEIKNDAGNPISVIGTTINPFGKPVVTVDDDTVQHTATNRRKVSNYEITKFNTFQYTKDPLIWDEEITGTASSSLDLYETMVLMTVGSTIGDKVVRQTKRILPYVPGRENEICMNFILEAQTSGIRQRLGMFDETAGLFLEDDGANYSVVVRKNTAGGVVETRIARANWNGDKLDGTGGSGITLDLSRIQTIVFEYNWFSGHAEIKFIIGNYAHSIHQFEFNNAIEAVYINSPFLPIRWEIENTGGTAGSHVLAVGSYATLSEAGTVPLGVKNTVITPLTGINCSSANTFYPILSIRLRSSRIKGTVLPLSFQVAALDNAPIFYKVLLNPTLTGATTWNTYADTHIEFNADATAVAEGDYTITAGYISPNGQGGMLTLNTESSFQLGRLNMGVDSEVITIVAASTSANKDVFASLTWIEVR
jgi:hypothetical protein